MESGIIKSAILLAKSVVRKSPCIYRVIKKGFVIVYKILAVKYYYYY